MPRLRQLADYLRYLDEPYRDAPYLRDRMLRYVGDAPAWHRRIPRRLAPAVVRGICAYDRLTAADARVRKALEELAPDVVVVSPLVARGISGVRQTETVKAAKELSIPVALAVGSWDHLSSKGIVKVVPDRVFVWNEVQRREAVELHRIPERRVVATGAQLFDQWFDASPSTSRDEFLEPLGLDPAQPYLLYVGSSPNITDAGCEQEFVRRWTEALRASGAPTADLGVLVRPHPGNVEAWSGVDLAPYGAAVLPRERPRIPMTAAEERVYFDSIHHSAAVVGINTSALIESLIQRRPVLTIRAPEFRETQEGTLHFHYLVPDGGGALLVADGLDEHVAQLRSVLADPAAVRASIDAFLAAFVRPHGLERPATPILADAIEELAAPGSARLSARARRRGRGS